MLKVPVKMFLPAGAKTGASHRSALDKTKVTAAATAAASSKKMKSPPKEMRGRQTPHNIVVAKSTVPEQFAQECTLQRLYIIAQSLGRIEKLLQSESRNELLFVANRGGSGS